jgi:hypothetical protein
VFSDEDPHALASSDRDHTRVCRFETGQNTNALIGAEVGQDGDRVEPAIVEIGNANTLELRSAEEVEEFVIALLRAAAVAFPGGPTPLQGRWCGVEVGPIQLQSRCGAEVVWMGDDGGTDAITDGTTDGTR